MPDVITTERMILRPYGPDEAPLLHALMSDTRVIFWAPRPMTTAESERWLADIHATPDGLGWRAAFARESDTETRHLSHVGLQLLTGGPDIEIAYHFHVDAWGKGLATEAARAILDHGFHQLDLERIVAIALPTNERSLRVIAKLGMPFIGERDHRGRAHRQFALTRDAYLRRQAASR